MKNKNKITKILQHDISWFVNSKKITELDSSSIEHIAYCLNDGISSGELVISYGKDGSKTTTGWWRIIDWKNIALVLYNSCDTDNKTPRQVAAMKRFDNEWNSLHSW